MVKHTNDFRYSKEYVITHDNKKIKSISSKCLSSLNDLVGNYQVICIDEIQFFSDAHIFTDLWANRGLVVEMSGLAGTYNRTPWPVITNLIPLCDHIKYLRAVCQKTGKNASYSSLKSNPENCSKDLVNIGGVDKYSASDRESFFDKDSLYKDTYKKFQEFSQSYSLSGDEIKKSIKIFDQMYKNDATKMSFKKIIVALSKKIEK
jgi:thymidine kinase